MTHPHAQPRPHILLTHSFFVLWQDPSAKEYLVNHETAARIELPSKFTHDVVAHGGGVYVADTGNGNVLEVRDFRDERAAISTHGLFTVREHVNTLAVDVDDDRYLWAMLHNLGPSILAKVDMKTWEVVDRIRGVGKSSHGVVQYEVQGRRKIVFLDSNEVSLGMVDVASKDVDVFYRLADAEPATVRCVEVDGLGRVRRRARLGWD